MTVAAIVFFTTNGMACFPFILAYFFSLSAGYNAIRFCIPYIAAVFPFQFCNAAGFGFGKLTAFYALVTRCLCVVCAVAVLIPKASINAAMATDFSFILVFLK